MKLAILTKKNITDFAFRSTVIEALRADGAFDVAELASSRDLNADFDKILVFGGDGTILDAVQNSLDFNVSILGVNLGNLGFLAKFDTMSHPLDIITSLKSEKTEKRMLLVAKLGGKELFSLNDIVIKSNSTRPLRLSLFIDGEYVDSYHSDGLIVSTPTGSTAYSLSAGGPVLAPSVEAVVINPVCAHSLHSRPLVIASSSKIEIRFGSEVADVVIDGNKVDNISGEGSVTISKSQKSAQFVYAHEGNFYSKLLEKMNRWGTTEILEGYTNGKSKSSNEAFGNHH